MSSRLLLRSFVSERLTAAAEEIFQVFEGTIAKYEEEASSSKQEIDRLRGLLLEFASTHKNFSQSPTSKEETPIKQHDSEPEQSVCQSNPELRHIKEEDPEPWACQQQMEVEQVQEFRHAADFAYLPHSSSAWDENEQEDTKLPLQPETQNGEREEQQETETVRYALPVASTLTSQALAQKERVQDGSEDERPAASLTSGQTQMNQTSQSSFSAPGESAPLSHIDPFAPEHRCQLCDKVFSTINYLINHAFHLHAKLGDVLCAVCGQALETTDSLNVHLKSHKASKSCQVCGKHYNNTTALSEHMVSHTGLKLHRCHVCGKECSRKGDLKIHMRIHTGEKPFCCSFCSKSFTHSGHLRKHMRSHTGERPHRCDVCGRGFLQSTHLKYHLGTHAQKL